MPAQMWIFCTDAQPFSAPFERSFNYRWGFCLMWDSISSTSAFRRDGIDMSALVVSQLKVFLYNY